MPETLMTATRLQAEFDEVLDRIRVSGDAVVVTVDGRPVARLVPIVDEGPLAGTVRVHADADDLIAPVDEPWNASSGSAGAEAGER